MSRRQFGRIRQLPSGRWQARYAVDGGELRTAPCRFPTKGDAARYLATIETDLARGQYIDPRLGMVTLWEWAEQWLARPGKRANSVARDRQALEAFLKDLGGRPVASITPMHVQGVVDVRAKLVSPATLARDFSALRAVLNSAVSADIIGRSPARKIALPRPRPPRRVGLRPDELEKLASEVPGRYRALVLMAGILGLRWGEAVGLRIRDIDFLRRTVTVSQVVEETAGHIAVVRGAKTDAGLRTLSAPAFLVDELARHLAEYRQILAGDPEGLVFVGPRGGILRRRFAERTFAPAVTRAGLDHSLTFHGLRHAAITTMVELGVHPRVMQGRAGHATSKLTMELYAHVPEAADRQAAEQLDTFYRQAVRGDPRASER